MKILGWGNLRINFRALLIAIFCIQISSSFAVADSINPTTNTPATRAITNIEDNTTVANETVNFINGEVQDFTFDNVIIENDVDFMMDADLANSTADNITATNSRGVVNISSLNFIAAAINDSTKVQIIKSSGLSLNIDRLLPKVETSVQATMYNDTILADSIALGDTSFANDSIVINGWKDVLYEMIQDKDYTHMLKNFVFRTDAEYTLTKDLGILGQETILAISNESGSDYGVLNGNGHSMFKLYEPVSKVTLNNILVKNALGTENGSVAMLDNNTATFTATNSVITDNKSNGNGGAFYVKNGTLTLTNSTVSNNSSDGKGGAIYTEAKVEIIADDAVTTFTGNTDRDGNNAIYVGSKDGVVNLTARNNGVIEMNDKIDGIQEGYKINVNGDITGNVKINNTVSNATIQLNSGVLTPKIESYLDGNNFVGNGGLLNLINGKTGTVAFNEVSIIGNTHIAIDADLRNRTVDRISSEVFNPSSGKLSITDINVLSDSIPNRVTVDFAEGGIKSAIANSVKVVYSKLYRYKVVYNKNNGQLTFIRGGGGGDTPGGDDNISGLYNPTILAAGIAQQVAYMNQLQNYQTAMYHSDAYMMLPKGSRHPEDKLNERIEANFKYCSNRAPIQDEIKSIWVRPYSSFESVPLKNGLKVSNISYGTLFGGHSDLIELKNGFNFVYGGYVGYNGNSTHFSGIDSTQQGAVVGVTGYLYKGNFFNSITANCGWMINETYTPYGTDTMNLIMSGIADRVGYNLEMASGKFIIQPSIFVGYTFVYSSDYTTNSGVRIETEPLNVIHFAPTLKLISNLSNGWQPYGIISVMANFMDKTEFTANTIRLPQMSIDPYVEYGLGIQRRWNENCQGFGQATIRNGGRRGVALLFGLKYMLGKITGIQPIPVPADRITDKKVKFKDRKAPEIEIVDWREAKKTNRVKAADEPVIVTEKKGLWDKLKSLKKFITLKYNTDVSAKVVSDTYSDGVIITRLKGMEKTGNYSTFIDVDMQEQDGDETEVKNKYENIKPEGVIIIENGVYNQTKPETTKVSQPEKPQQQKVVTEDSENKPVQKTDFIKRLNKRYTRILRVNQTNYYRPEKKYDFNEYTLEIIKF